MVSGKRIIVSGHLMESRKPLPQLLSEGRAQKLGDQNMGPTCDYSFKLFGVASSQTKRKIARIACWSEHDGC
jgi:hypothetical protein